MGSWLATLLTSPKWWYQPFGFRVVTLESHQNPKGLDVIR